MTQFETLKARIARAVASDSIEDKTVMLEEVETPGLFDGFTAIEVMVLKTGVSDLRRTRYELVVEQTEAQVLQSA
jgi:hypothetical protein